MPSTYIGSFLDAEFENDVRFPQSRIVFQLIDFKSRKFVSFTIFEGL